MAVLRVKNGDTWQSITTIRGEVGPQGPQGPQGEKGEKGDNAQLTGNLTFVQNQSNIENKGKTIFDGMTAKTINVDEPVMVEMSTANVSSSTLIGTLPNVSELYNGLMIKMFIPVISATAKTDLKFNLTLADGTVVSKDVYKNKDVKLNANEVPEASFMLFIYRNDYAVGETVYDGWRLVGSAASGGAGGIPFVKDVTYSDGTLSGTVDSLTSIKDGQAVFLAFPNTYSGGDVNSLALTLKSKTQDSKTIRFSSWIDKTKGNCCLLVYRESLGYWVDMNGLKDEEAGQLAAPTWYDNMSTGMGILVFNIATETYIPLTDDNLTEDEGSLLNTPVTFDYRYPILYCPESSGRAYVGLTNISTSFMKINALTSSGVVEYNKPVYLMGKISGTNFTTLTGQESLFTQELNNADEAVQYLELGILTNEGLWLLPYHEVFTRIGTEVVKYGSMPYIASTVDIGAGAALPTGTLYFVYEE